MAETQYKHITGMGDLQRLLEQIPAEMRNTVLLAGVKAAAVPVVKWAKRFAKRSERTGALRESITFKGIGNQKRGTALAIIGPDRKYYSKGKRLVRGKLITSGEIVRPSKYAHLVEFGHHVVAPFKGTTRRKGTAVPAKNKTTWVAAKPFIRPAIMQAKGESLAAFQRVVEKALIKGGKPQLTS